MTVDCLFAEQPETPPDYIFPLVSGQYFTVETLPISRRCSTSALLVRRQEEHLDRLLVVDRDAPVYSDGNRVVTIRLKHYLWSNASL